MRSEINPIGYYKDITCENQMGSCLSLCCLKSNMLSLEFLLRTATSMPDYTCKNPEIPQMALKHVSPSVLGFALRVCTFASCSAFYKYLVCCLQISYSGAQCLCLNPGKEQKSLPEITVFKKLVQFYRMLDQLHSSNLGNTSHCCFAEFFYEVTDFYQCNAFSYLKHLGLFP